MRKTLLHAILFCSFGVVAQQPCIPGSSPLQLGGNTGTNSLTVGTCSNTAFGIKSNDTVRLVIRPDGRMAFGRKQVVSSHPHANSIFQFDGKVACKELVVVDPAKWSDFVFKNNYRLMPLNQLEQYYKTFNHLPGVPSEAQVKKDGINIAEMDAVLLQKIEELTLYVVELNKKLEKLQKENTELKNSLK